MTWYDWLLIYLGIGVLHFLFFAYAGVAGPALLSLPLWWLVDLILIGVLFSDGMSYLWWKVKSHG